MVRTDTLSMLYRMNDSNVMRLTELHGVMMAILP